MMPRSVPAMDQTKKPMFHSYYDYRQFPTLASSLTPAELSKVLYEGASMVVAFSIEITYSFGKIYFEWFSHTKGEITKQ